MWCKKRFDVVKFKHLFSNLRSLVFLHIFGYLFKNIFENNVTLVMTVSESFSKPLGILSGNSDFLDVDLEQLLEVSLIGINRDVVLRLIGELCPGLLTALLLNSILRFLLKIIILLHLSAQRRFSWNLLSLSEELDFLSFFGRLLLRVVRSLFNHYFLFVVLKLIAAGLQSPIVNN